MRWFGLIAAPVLALALAGSVGAGSYVPPPGDCCPQWSPHGTQIVFATTRGNAAVGSVASTGGPEQFVPGIPAGTRSPDWTYVAYFQSGSLAVSKVDGSDKHLVARTSGPFDWAPDSKQLALRQLDGSLAVVRPNGSGLQVIAPKPKGADGVSYIAWSPSSARIAYVRADGLHLVNASGGGDVVLARGAIKTPVWADDGLRLAFVRGNDIVVQRPGVTARSYPAGPGTVVTALLGDATLYLDERDNIIRLELAGGTRRILASGAQVTVSPSGTSVAFADGGECRDRLGVYVMRVDGSGLRRLTNSCTITGTPGPDVLHGDFSRVVLGLGGNDTLYADDTYYFFDGNTLNGGPGDDRLVGGFAQDTLLGGPGDDVITGGASRDVITGGPGRDRIDAGGGGDVVYARDGQRDIVHCGKNGYGKAGRDVVYADRIDVVGSDCEIVHRS